MATADVTCASCSQPTSFEYPDDHSSPAITWDCPNPDCQKPNRLEFPDNRAEATPVAAEPGVEEVADVDGGQGRQQGA